MAKRKRRSGAEATASGDIWRRPTLVRVAIALVGLIAVGGLYQYFQSRHPKESEAASEPRSRSIAAPAPPVANPGKEAAIGSATARRDDETATLAKPPARKSILAQRDPGLEAWFVNAYLHCWTPPSRLPEGEKYAAQIRIVHNADGSLSQAPYLVNPPSDPEWRAYADSAIRAVAKCPLSVPAEYHARFDQWKKMTLHFSPDGAL